ncbi:hypothetical protein CEUSTIGMA_g13721.t1 [Chlamydomonas eustigma]|uniref:R3H domain-containing protein n=1 Tax=Chlamydomonas eustigma TaxID=1157962 RepID=A0A250XTL5_9CHLO|nr:hypothetical protein CEUSTIGMA_g13721.t1 [Chlamydomonas eustigma]|eukprot:GAX86309.1 hypothetical protein CEUSTIGMA_g13721.t1 [Chlamydomonas eustigma]
MVYSINSGEAAARQQQQLQYGGRELSDAVDLVDGGYMVIDDDLGEAGFPATGPGAAAAARASGRGPAVGGARLRGGRNGGSRIEEEFPTLASASGVWASNGVASSPAAANAHNGSASSILAASMALRKFTSKCPCGRRSMSYALREGEQPPPLECDHGCEIEGRRRQLAQAFNVDDPDHHIAYFDRNRTPTYSTSLLQVAKEHLAFVEHVEQQLTSFIGDSGLKRLALAPMTHSQRSFVHELAEEGYGLATVSLG